MGVKLLEIGVQMRKVVIFSIRVCYRTVNNHPFLVGMLCFLALLYRSYPFMFSALVSISPVIVCTGILLGTLLSFGHPNTPEIEREEKTVHDILVPLKSGVFYDASVVEKDESYSVERYIDKEWDTTGQSIEELSLGENKICEVERDNSFGDGTPVIEKESQEIQLESRVFDEPARYLYHSGSEQKNKNKERHGDVKVLEYRYFPIPNMDDDNLEFDNDKSVDSFDSKMVNIDSHPGSLWKQEEEEQEEDEEEDESLDSVSDQAESSSPDSSMASITPMLDELHPLLDEDTPQPVNLSHTDFDAAFEQSKPSDSDDDFNGGIVNQGELEAADDENEDGEDEEDIQGDKEECNKSAITWTEEDQKNIMDLGSSELERNQWLEILIARRRSRKSMRALAERNLIDLESVDLPLNIAPISTARKNPFDIPDYQNDLRLPPIPGSAPSILLPKRNPFDLPYDSGEEKPDLMEDSFQKEFMTFQPKEPFFRRHESFKVQQSLFGPDKQVKHDIRLRPYFVPERMESEGANYTPFQRQSSDISDSKVSSVAETESTGSGSDLEDKDLIEENIKGKDLNDNDLVDENIIDQHISQEPDLMSSIEHVSEHVGHVSNCSEVESLELGGTGKTEIFCVDIEFEQDHEETHHDEDPSLIQEGNVANMLDFIAVEINSTSASFEQNYSWHSISSSLSEASEKIFVDRGAQWLSGLEERSGHAEEKAISIEPSLERSDVNITRTSTDDNPHGKPIYDSSPTSLRKHSSLSSISSDLNVDSEMGLSPASVRASVSFAERESVESGQEINMYTLINEEMSATLPNSQPVDKVELVSGDTMDINTQEVLKFKSEDNEASSGASTSAVTQGVVAKVFLDSKATLETSEDEKIHLAQDKNLFPMFDPNVHIKASHCVDLIMKSVSNFSEDPSIDQFESREPFSTAEEFSLVQRPYTSFDRKPVEKNLINQEAAALHSRHDGIDLSNLDTNKDTDPQCQEDEKLISVGYRYGLEEKFTSQYDEELALSGTCTSMNNLPSKDRKEVQEAPLILVDSVGKAGLTNSCPTSASVLHKIDEAMAELGQSDIKKSVFNEVEIAKHIQGSENHKVLLETVEYHGNMQHLIEDTGGIKDIDEELLSELDAGGDFSIKESRSSLNEFESESRSSKRVILHTESSLIENEIQFEARSTEGIDLDHMQLHEDNSEKHFLHDSVDVKVNTGEPSVLVLKQALEANLEKSMKLNSKDGSLEVGPDEGGSSNGVEPSLKAVDVPEGSKGDAGKLHYEVDRSEDSYLAPSSEQAYYEAPKHDSSSIMDVKDKGDSLKSDASSSFSSDPSSRDSDRE